MLRFTGHLVRFALLALLPPASLVAGTVTYTYVEDLPSLLTTDQPTATWTYIWPGTPTPYLNGALTLTGSPVLNAAAITDGYTYTSGDPTFHAGGAVDFAGVDPNAVFSAGGNTYQGAFSDICTTPTSNTSCVFDGGDMNYNINGGASFASGWGVDTMTITSAVPEPGTLALTVCGFLILGSVLLTRTRKQHWR